MHRVRRARRVRDVVLVRLEQISPFAHDLVLRVVAQYTGAELVWCQEEPKNMGAWGYVQPRLQVRMRSAGGEGVGVCMNQNAWGCGMYAGLAVSSWLCPCLLPATHLGNTPPISFNPCPPSSTLVCTDCKSALPALPGGNLGTTPRRTPTTQLAVNSPTFHPPKKPLPQTALRQLHEEGSYAAAWQSKLPVRYIGRPPAASPATASFSIHQKEQQDIIDAAFAP